MRKGRSLLLPLLVSKLVSARPPLTACPPSCANNELVELLDTFCSDKGTFWQSKHHYGSAYHSIFGSIRESVASILEVGIGEDTAPSVAAWSSYFPNAHIYPIDIKTTREVAQRAEPDGATDKLVRHQAKFGCEYNRSMWLNPRVHLTLDTDASNPEQLKRVSLPATLDIVIDDGSHLFRDQEATLATLWSRVRPGGFYIVEDMLVGALPWSKAHALQVPTNNSACGHECFFPQRIAEHPFMFDRFSYEKGPSATLTSASKKLMRENDWFWVVTGMHRGGGLDCSLVIRKKGPAIGTLGLPERGLGQGQGQGRAGAASASPETDAALARAWDELRAARAEHTTLTNRQADLASEIRRSRTDDATADARRFEALRVCPMCAGASSLPWLLLAASVSFNAIQMLRGRTASGARQRSTR